MKKIKNHIDELFKDIPRNKETEMVKQEIIQNLEEKVFYLMEQGKEQEDAINKAIVEFGDIEDLKKELGVKEPEKKNMSKLNLEFSIWGSGLIIVFFIFINLYYTPNIIWAIYPIFAILWWPLTMYFVWSRKKWRE
ncbi:permease prefix domain 1-containing protein [Lysinibacillus sp. CNPSo 3705]|uniref:permease prefix domain 1-containing protein n=1 Tax=Lysinibacillus sp. CNPSo 3705 TaxID=3028148 RepID=UPI00104830E6|nr:permease prefix domain 1-containing protein [Lysinibacillus sp. CNPSo 3705]MDD1501348.1 permease prefix domain 1-containing protein [Lysinibacillus sp. CNPSo 3705]